MLASAALVMFMTPGLAFFYGGLVRAKNVLGTVMQSFVALGLVTVLWALVGYTLAFGPDKGGLIGGLKYAGLSGVGANPSVYAPTVPATTYMVFQLMFAIITPALIAGAFAERMKFSGYLVFIGLWSIVVYAPVAPASAGPRPLRRPPVRWRAWPRSRRPRATCSRGAHCSSAPPRASCVSPRCWAGLASTMTIRWTWLACTWWAGCSGSC